MENQVALWATFAVVIGIIYFATVLFFVRTTIGAEPSPKWVPLRDDQFVPVLAPPSAATPAPVITDWLPPTTSTPGRPIVPQPSARIIKVPKPVERPTSVVGVSKSHGLIGTPSWYCESGHSICVTGHPDTAGFDAYAAAGPRLRVAMGGGISVHAPQPWRNKIVLVNGLRVKLIDWCQCYLHTSYEKVIDLYHDVWARLGEPRRVTIRW